MSVSIKRFCKCGIQLPKSNRTGLCRFCYREWFDGYMRTFYLKKPEVKEKRKLYNKKPKVKEAKRLYNIKYKERKKELQREYRNRLKKK